MSVIFFLIYLALDAERKTWLFAQMNNTKQRMHEVQKWDGLGDNLFSIQALLAHYKSLLRFLHTKTMGDKDIFNIQQ